MTVLLDITIQHLIERKYKIETCQNWFSRFYWFKKSEIKKIDEELQIIKNNNFTRVLLPEKKYHDFTFNDIFEAYLEYYIFDENYIPLGKYMNTYFHTEMVGYTEPVEIKFVNAIFVKDSTGSNIYARSDIIISRPVYVKNIHMHSVAV